MKITREEANTLYAFKTRFLEEGFSLREDQIELASACQEVYTHFLGLEKPTVFISDGPFDATSILSHITGKELSQKHNGIIPFASHTSCTLLGKTIDISVFALARDSKEKLKESLGKEKFQEVRNILFRDLNFQLSQSVYQVVERSIQNGMKRKGKAVAEFCAHPSFADRDWLGFYKICAEVFEVDNSIPANYSRLLNSGLFSGFFYHEFAVLVPSPASIHKNENLVLHNEDAAAITWDDGTSLAYWNGVEVPLSLVCEPDKITAADILNETNAEVRRCYQEKLGSEKFGSLLGLIDLDKKTDRFGNELVLYRTKKIDKVAGDFIYFAKVVCPSTGRNYFLCVPPGMSKVEEAVSWTFGKTPEDYRPSIET